MAMLAEPRRKTKYPVDPRGTNWSKDDNKFGQKLLEKMGWSKGKGLGAQENGSIENVGIKMKSDNKGVGFTNKFADKWIEHQDDFNDLLACLNQEQNNSDNMNSDEHKVTSLENNSQKSRRRVHYMKFTKGKDLSSRSKEDLDCIFGKRKNKKVQKQEMEEEVVQEVIKNGTINTDHGVQTITKSLSIEEYFALKMKQKRQLMPESSESSNQSIPLSDSISNQSEELAEDTRSEKKRKRVSFNPEYQYKYIDDDTKSEDERQPKRRKLNFSSSESNIDVPTKRAKKKKDKTEVMVENGDENAVHYKKVKKSKKKKKKSKATEEEIEELGTVKMKKKKIKPEVTVDIEDEEYESKRSKKKMKKCKEDNDESEINIEKQSKKKKKTSKNVTMEDSEVTEEEEVTKKKKKKKLKTSQESVIDNEDIHESEDTFNDIETNNAHSADSNPMQNKKKKKTSRNIMEDSEAFTSLKKTKNTVMEEEEVTKKKNSRTPQESVINKDIHESDVTINDIETDKAHVVDCKSIQNRQVVRTEYHPIDQDKCKYPEHLISNEVECICTSFFGSNIQYIVGYENSGLVVTDYYS